MASAIEQRTIDIIPHDERHGKSRDLFTIWFGSNILPLTIITGALGPAVYGLSFTASLVAILIGNLGGGLLMALHSAQGPKLGVPQMIQSRGQFGSIGSVIVVLIAVFMYIGFFASNLALAGETINLANSNIDPKVGEIAAALIALVVVVFGYNLIHTLNKIATVVLGIAMIVGMVMIVANGLPADFFTHGGGIGDSFGAFLGMVSIAATWQLAYAPYVSDYSRYMPKNDEGARSAFLASYWGCTLGSILPMVWGVMAALAIPEAADAINGINTSVGKLGVAFMILFFLTASQSNAINLYGGTLCTITVIQTFATKWLPRAAGRWIIGAIFIALSLYIALTLTDFLTSYSAFVLILSYMLIPWTAINLVDFYMIRKGKYHVESFFHESGGIYGRFNWVAIGSYFIGIAAEAPFANPSSAWKGMFVDSLGGADIAWIVGLIVTGTVYYFWAKATKQDVVPVEVLHELS
jgi:NCS1 family nucleobase:cation symporter-1